MNHQVGFRVFQIVHPLNAVMPRRCLAAVVVSFVDQVGTVVAAYQYQFLDLTVVKLWQNGI